MTVGIWFREKAGVWFSHDPPVVDTWSGCRTWHGRSHYSSYEVDGFMELDGLWILAQVSSVIALLCGFSSMLQNFCFERGHFSIQSVARMQAVVAIFTMMLFVSKASDICTDMVRSQKGGYDFEAEGSCELGYGGYFAVFACIIWALLCGFSFYELHAKTRNNIVSPTDEHNQEANKTYEENSPEDC